MRFSGIVLVALSLCGCAIVEKLQSNEDSRYIRKVDAPLIDIRSILINQLPIGQGAASSNGREFKSKYFVYSNEHFRSGDAAIDRYIAQFVILGDRRPYDVEVTVFHERRVLRGTQFVYSQLGLDPHLAQVLVQRLQEALSKRREDRNIIDDFRVY